MRFAKIINGIIVDVAVGAKCPIGDGWTEMPEHFNGNSGDKWPEMFDSKTGRLLSEQELIKKGLKENETAIYFNIDDPNEKKRRYELGNLDNYTLEKPIEGEDAPHQKFDRAKKKWVIDTAKKERAGKERRLGELKGKVNELEQKQYRPQRDIALGIKPDKAIERLQEIENEIDSMRPEMEKLDKELKSA